MELRSFYYDGFESNSERDIGLFQFDYWFTDE